MLCLPPSLALREPALAGQVVPLKELDSVAGAVQIFLEIDATDVDRTQFPASLSGSPASAFTSDSRTSTASRGSVANILGVAACR